MNETMFSILIYLMCLIVGVGLGFILADWINRKRMNFTYNTFTALYERAEKSWILQNKSYDETINSLREVVSIHEKTARRSSKKSSDTNKHRQ